MKNSQRGILAPVPSLGRYLSFSLRAGSNIKKGFQSLAEITDGTQIVVGIGQPTVVALGKSVPGLRAFPTNFGAGLILPSTSSAVKIRGRCYICRGN